MCELSDRITTWRDGMGGRLSAAELAELEDHLRETLGGLPEDALSPDERFLIATRRLGAPGAIVAEFEKADPARVWQGRVLWMLMGWAGVGLICGLTGFLAQAIALLAWDAGVSPGMAELWAFAEQVVVWLLVGCLLTALMRGHDRGVRVMAGRYTRLPGVVKGIIVAAVALVLLGVPGSLATIVRARTMVPAEFGNQMYYLAIGNLATNVVVTVSFIALAPWLASQQQRRVAAPADPGGTG